MKTWIIICLCLSFNYAKSQFWDYSYTHYGKADGLPSNTVYSVCTDRNGIMWIGTDAGLSRFDGNHFVTFTTEDGLPSNDVFEITCDSKNRLWQVTMSNSISYYSKGVINNNVNNKLLSKISIPDRIGRVIEDKQNNIWLLSYPFTLNKISPKGEIEIFKLDKSAGTCYKLYSTEKGVYFFSNLNSYNYSYTKRKIESIEASNKKGFIDLLINSDNSLIIADLSNNLIDLKKNLDSISLYTSIQLRTIFNSNNKIWLLSNNGVKTYLQNNKHFEANYLPNYIVSNLTTDLNENTWFSTLNNGLFKLNSLKVKTFKYNKNDNFNSIYSVAVNKDYIVVGNNNLELTILKRKSHEIIGKISLSPNHNLGLRILKIIILESKLLVCTDNGIYSVYIETKRINSIDPNHATKNVYLISDSLIVLDNLSVRYFKNNGSLLAKFINHERFYSFTPYNNLKLFGSENTLYYEKDSLIPYTLDKPFHYRLMDMKVVDSLLVIATTEKGVFFIKDHTILRNVNLSNGLNSNNCSKIVPYKNDLFIATNNGICIYNYLKDSMTKIFESDGLASNNVLDIAIDADTLYAGTDNGLSVIPLMDLNIKKSFAFFINPIIHNTDTIWDDTKSLHSRSDSKINLKLNALTLGVKGKVDYYYRIRELDTIYKSTLDPNISINSLKPGNYHFDAYSIDANGLNSVPALLVIDVIPYWYQTNWFKCGLLVLILFGFYLLYRYVVQVTKLREQKKNEFENRIKKLELDAWKSNINPHFLFNTFNTMQSLFSSEKFEKANVFIANFSSLLRKTIDNSSKLMNSYHEEVEYLNNYLALERVKKNDRFEYTINVNSENIYSYFIPSLLLQPVIENAIKHGIKQDKGGVISVDLIEESNHILCIIKDNGVGLPDIDKDYTHSKGLRLVRDKIRIVENITKEKITFTIQNYYSHEKKCLGVVATFILPLFSTDKYA